MWNVLTANFAKKVFPCFMTCNAFLVIYIFFWNIPFFSSVLQANFGQAFTVKNAGGGSNDSGGNKADLVAALIHAK